METEQNQQTGEVINNNLVWAILATLFCCLPLGIYAIVLAAKVDGLAAAGKIAEAKETAAKAKKWSLYAAVAAAAGWVIYFIVMLWFVGVSATGSQQIDIKSINVDQAIENAVTPTAE